MPTIDNIEQFYADIFNMLESGEIDEAQADDLLDQADDLTEDKIHAYGQVIVNLESQASAIKAHIDERAKILKSKKANIDWMRRRALTHMERNGFKKLEFADVSVTVRRNKPSVIIDNLDDLPGKFVKRVETISADKKALYDALKDAEVTGAHLAENHSLLIK